MHLHFLEMYSSPIRRSVVIYGPFGENVTENYLITDENSYWAGALIIEETEDVLGIFDLDLNYHGITSRDIGDLVE